MLLRMIEIGCRDLGWIERSAKIVRLYGEPTRLKGQREGDLYPTGLAGMGVLNDVHADLLYRKLDIVNRDLWIGQSLYPLEHSRKARSHHIEMLQQGWQIKPDGARLFSAHLAPLALIHAA